MKSDEFVKEVMHRAGIASRTASDNAVRATLETLSEHLTEEAANNLAAQLPTELATYLQQPFAGVADRFSLDEFFARVSQREGVGITDAISHARTVAAVLAEAISLGELEHFTAQLPADLAQLFYVQNEGELPSF
jgi:uncharacterized protein (DUF2267 family)